MDTLRMQRIPEDTPYTSYPIPLQLLNDPLESIVLTALIIFIANLC